MYITVLLAALVSTACITQMITNDSAAKTMSWNACNGLDHLCDLWVDQVTFSGTHNSGSEFDGLLYYYIGTAAGSYFYHNHAGKKFHRPTVIQAVYAPLTLTLRVVVPTQVQWGKLYNRSMHWWKLMILSWCLNLPRENIGTYRKL